MLEHFNSLRCKIRNALYVGDNLGCLLIQVLNFACYFFSYCGNFVFSHSLGMCLSSGLVRAATEAVFAQHHEEDLNPEPAS